MYLPSIGCNNLMMNSPLTVGPTLQHPNRFEQRHDCLELTDHSLWSCADRRRGFEDLSNTEEGKEHKKLLRAHQPAPPRNSRSRRHISPSRTRSGQCHCGLSTLANNLAFLSSVVVQCRWFSVGTRSVSRTIQVSPH